MDELSDANKNVNAVLLERERKHREETEKIMAEADKLDSREEELLKCLADLEKKKLECAKANGDVDAADGDVICINAGGKEITAKRSTLTQLKGTRLEGLFSGRWDKKLQRDSNGRIFLDVSPVGFQAVVDYLSELAISSEDDSPDCPSVDDEHMPLLRHQLELFGLAFPESSIIKSAKEAGILLEWLGGAGSDGKLSLLYRSSRDGTSTNAFHSKCDNKGCTLTVVKTTDGYVFGGYSNTPWTSPDSLTWLKADKAFLFVLSGGGIESPYRMMLKSSDGKHAVTHHSQYSGPCFGMRDLDVDENGVRFCPGYTYQHDPSGNFGRKRPSQFQTIELEVFHVAGHSFPTLAQAKYQLLAQHEASKPAEAVLSFSEDVNEAISLKQKSLLAAEAEILHSANVFQDEQEFVATFASGDADLVTLDVSGTLMTTKRATLQMAEDSVLAQQFDATKWTKQGTEGYSTPGVEGWSADDVASWANGIDGIPEDVGGVLKKNEIKGTHLLAMNMEGLKMIGIANAGILCLLLKEIGKLEEASKDVTLIEHSPYCFGKILDYLRMKRLNAEGLASEPALPTVSDTQKKRFEKVVRYYFPGDSAAFILGETKPASPSKSTPPESKKRKRTTRRSI